MTDQDQFLLADKPLEEPAQDQLGYSMFARHLAESLATSAPPQGLVVAIHGPWGSGKSTVLNFLAHELQQLPQSDQPIITRFNPWWFPGTEHLIQLVLFHIYKTLHANRVIVGEWAKKLIILAEGLANKSISSVLFESTLLNEKEKVEKCLRNSRKRMVVMIDDIDRLTAEEIRQLFSAVKAVADFPNVIYVLAFDTEVVVHSLEEEYKSVSGRDYLEKIVQVSFNLPLPDKLALRKILWGKLEKLLFEDIPQEEFDMTHWLNVYLDGIDRFIVTPRDVTRLVNCVSITFPAVTGEVNPIDFLAIETLRVFMPAVYDTIRHNAGRFAGYSDGHRFRVEDEKEFHNAWLSKLPEADQEPTKRMLIRLFPKLEAVWGNTYCGHWQAQEWYRSRRVSSEKVFPVYFRLAIPEGDISAEELQYILACTGDAVALGNKLVALSQVLRPDGTTKVRALLELLENYTADAIPLEHIDSIIRALFEVGDKLLVPADERQHMLDIGNNLRIGPITWQLLARVNPQSRYRILRDAIRDGDALGVIVNELVSLGQQHGKYGGNAEESDHLISAEDLARLEKLALTKIRKAASNNNELMMSPELPSILHRWRAWGKPEEVARWVRNQTKTDDGLLHFLSKFVQWTSSYVFGNAAENRSRTIHVKSVSEFIDAEKTYKRLNAMSSNSSGELEDARKLFIRAYESIQQGKLED